MSLRSSPQFLTLLAHIQAIYRIAVSATPSGGFFHVFVRKSAIAALTSHLMKPCRLGTWRVSGWDNLASIARLVSECTHESSVFRKACLILGCDRADWTNLTTSTELETSP
jgi:hypothetical protein